MTNKEIAEKAENNITIWLHNHIGPPILRVVETVIEEANYVDKLAIASQEMDLKGMHEYVDELVKALKGVKRGSCWCEMAIGNPMVSSHDSDCKFAKRVLKEVEE